MTVLSWEDQVVTAGGAILVAFAIPFSLSPNGDVGFRAATSGGTGVFRTLGGAVQEAAVTGDDADGTAGPSPFQIIGGATNTDYVPEFNSSANAVFRATTGAPAFVRGVWADTGTAVVNLAIEGVDAPGVPGSPFIDFRAPAINESGALAFRGCLNATCSTDGVWNWNGTALEKVATDVDVAPDKDGLSTTDLFGDFSNPVINATGTVAFQAALSQPPSTQGIWRNTGAGPSSLRRIVRTGDVLRGTSLTFGTFGSDLAIAETGQLAFTATMSDLNLGLFVISDIGTIVKIAKVGDSYTIPGVGPDVIDAIDFYPGSSAQGNTGFIHYLTGLPNKTAIVYRLRLKDPSNNEIVNVIVLTTLE